METEYYNSFFNYRRFKTSEVKTGKIIIGGDNPVLPQSMTNTETKNVELTVNQCKRIFDSGAGLVRITIPSVKDVSYLKTIRQLLNNDGYTGPLSADVHFSSVIAEESAKVVEKVRINPGNFVRSLSANIIDDAEALSQIREALVRLINICKKNGTVLRIGTNHGSLSERILQKYGDTPIGMVESTMEFLRICMKEEFFDVVISLKSSNVKVMVHANRMLVREMKRENMNFPVHLGVTEAGEGEDGRIKSSTGIGSLLQDGIGDTIRVSLTEEPENEIPVCQTIIDYYKQTGQAAAIEEIDAHVIDYYSYKRQKSNSVLNIGDSFKPVVISNFSDIEKEVNFNFKPDRYPDLIYLGVKKVPVHLSNYQVILDYKAHPFENFNNYDRFPLMDINEYLNCELEESIPRFLNLGINDLTTTVLNNLKNVQNTIIVANYSGHNYTGALRFIILKLKQSGCYSPVIAMLEVKENTDLSVVASCATGPLFIDGLADGLFLKSDGDLGNEISVSFGILQATRARITRTEFISCPGCGRTLFNLQSVSEKIRQRTSHLKGVKIAIMGCIVNGPGEMADADFGYVGSLKGKVTLYKGKTPVYKNVSEKNAVDELIELIKDSGQWTDP